MRIKIMKIMSILIKEVNKEEEIQEDIEEVRVVVIDKCSINSIVKELKKTTTIKNHTVKSRTATIKEK
jgi:hypothetical protein